MAKDTGWRSPETVDHAPATAPPRIERGPEPRIGDPVDLPPPRPDAERDVGRGPEPRIGDAPATPAGERPTRIESVDEHFPGLYDRSHCRPSREVDAGQPASEWIADRNPGYPHAPGRDNNCGDCARASELTWRGLDTGAGALADPEAGGELPAVMDTWSPGDRVETSFADIKDTLEFHGAGASALVGVYWRHGGGHWFNAFNDEGAVTAADGQKGKTEAWPPSLEHLQFDEHQCETVFAIFIAPDGRHLRQNGREVER